MGSLATTVRHADAHGLKYLLAASRRPLLRSLVTGPCLLAFDFDGTLVPLRDRPELVELAPQTRRQLAALARRVPVCVISGRSRPDVARLLRPVPLFALYGNHGAEPHREASRFRAAARLWLRSLRESLAGAPGVVLEDKRVSLAVHFRASPNRQAARRAIVDAIGHLEGPVRIVPGKAVLNVVHSNAPHKGDALELAAKRARAQHVLYVGDDENDEDVFGIAKHHGWLTARVGRSPRSAAAYFLRNQGEVGTLLEILCRTVADR